ncbi:hypothetical protein GUJ93_ZPchr0006g44016 [Zizania palustris]|uniref:Uncharacterized protein n=1 Tax=Zizania palustris TaxID=103762 RepID=A0A8J5SXV6_ZIZPA|nr:hypothetical protein GUJ93_ZPchr0006g44016 [Zizania palustris]
MESWSQADPMQRKGRRQGKQQCRGGWSAGPPEGGGTVEREEGTSAVVVESCTRVEIGMLEVGLEVGLG